MFRNLRKSLLLSVLILTVGAAGLAVQSNAALAAPTTCGGLVFQDYDADGERSEDYSHISADYANWLDDPVPDIDVEITTNNGTVLTTTTDIDGEWDIALDTTDFPIRIDFSGLPTDWASAPIGPDNGPLTQFITDPAECGVGGVGSAALVAPGTFCENRPEIVTTCFLFGGVAGHDSEPAVVSLIDGAIDNLTTEGTGFQDDPYTVRATLGEVGSVYGIAERPQDDSVYAGSLVKRHTELGPSGNPTTIYRIDPSNNVTEFFTTDANAVDPHSGQNDGWELDVEAFDDVGKAGLGDIAISHDGSTLYVVDLGQKELVAIPINADGSANAGGVVRTAITAAGLGAPCIEDDLRPFGLGIDTDGSVLVSATCTAESTTAGLGPTSAVSGPVLGDPTQLSAAIYDFDGTNFSFVVDVPIPTTSRGSQSGTLMNFSDIAEWRPWVSEPPYASNSSRTTGYAQPLVSDITVDGDDLVIGIMDIWGHQMGANALYERDGNVYRIAQPVSSGDTVRAVSTGTGYTFPTSGPDFFYDGDNYNNGHAETTLGAPVQIPGRPYLISNAFDPINPAQTWQSGGLEWFANETTANHDAGEHVRGYRVYDGGPGSQFDTFGSFEKAAGIGDVQALCGSAPIEVGNRVWVDANADGIADPAEVPVIGAVVELLDANGNVLATTTTDADGLYYFHSDDIAGFDRHGGDYQIRLAQDNYDAGGVFAAGGAYDDTPITTVNDAGSDDGNDSDAVDVNGLPTISFTATDTDHTMDIGVTGVFDLALTKVYTSDSFDAPTDGVIAPGADVTFTITVENQGTLDTASFEVTDYLPAGFTLNDADWTAGAGNTATITDGPLAAGASTTIDITLTAGTATADFVNWAEISDDDGDDVDSTPDANQGNDSQPAGPGDPTDDVTDNTSGDEDDHDPAPISVVEVPVYDLALTKVYTSDTSGALTDGVIEPGADVTFTITVENQGNVDAGSFEVTDYIPVGFSLNDADWTAGAGNTATISGGPLAAGASVDIEITLTADSVAPGDFVNWAEISSDDGDDVDSTPDANQGNDDQPTGPGAPTDDVTDNTPDGNGAADEDDHDPAGVSVTNFDLALQKVYASDTSGAPTDGVIEPGADVTFTITVFNQGTIDAASFEVTDYIPVGFVLSAAEVGLGAWTAGAGNTATYAGGPLAAGASTTIDITLTADPDIAAGDFVNWAEISSDDGNDMDSTPDANQGNDSQPAGPGEPTDDEVDNASGDEDDHDPAPITVEVFDLALTKVYTSDSFDAPTDGVIAPGADVTFTITVENQGSVDAASFEVTDYLPAGFTLNETLLWTDNGDGTATFTGGPLAAGASVDIDVTMTAGATIGDFVNWAEISSDSGDDIDSTPDANQGNDSQPAGPGEPTDDEVDNASGDEDDHDPAPISVVDAPVYDLALTKVYTSDTSGAPTDGIIEEGADVTFTITVENQGNVDAGSFEVTDYLPVGFVLSAAEVGLGAWTAGAGNTATFTGGPLAAGASVDIDITLTADSVAPGEFVNWAEISSDDGDDVDSTADANQRNDSQPAGPGEPTDDEVDNASGDEDDHDPAGVSVANFDLALTKVYTSDTAGAATDGVIVPGADVTFTITVENQGTIDAGTFTVTDYLPAGFTLNDAAWSAGAGDTATIDGGPLAAGASTTIDITLTAGTATGDFVNWAEISSDDGNDIDSIPDANQRNDAQPTGPGAPTDDVTDNTPDGNGAADEDDHDPAPITVEIFDLALQKVYTSDTFGDATDGVIQPGADVTFTITVFNQGSVDATTFDVVDYFPAGFVLSAAEVGLGAWTDNGDGTASLTGGPLAAGASRDLTITLTALNPAAGDLVNGAEITSDDGDDIDSTPDTDPADDNQPAAPGDPTDDEVDNAPDANGEADEDDHDIAGLTVVIYDLALQKVFTSDTFGDPADGVIENGADATFMITVFNQGTVDAGSFTVTDYLPVGFVLSAAEVGLGAWTDNGDGTATISGGPLAAGASTDLTITLTADTAAPGDSVNWAEISDDDGVDIDSITDDILANDIQPAAPGDPTDDVTDNSDRDEDDHDPAGVQIVNFDLALQKVYTSDTHNARTDGIIEAGADVTFTITVFNQGTVDSSGVTITDFMPAGFVLNDAAWTDNGDGTASINTGAIPAGGQLPVTITMTADNVDAGSFVNGAEISTDDGNDVDSAPDADPADDNQPAAPGDPTDDEVNNAPDGNGEADEDDHDIAGVSVEVFDLALTKVYTSDTFGDPTDAVIDTGAEVTFTITVFNQGTVDAGTFDVTDFLPVGFTLNDAAWTDNGDGTATITGGPLAAGASVDIDITMTAGVVAPGGYVNGAEISADDGNDADSTPDSDPADDNQPSSPGDPTDDVIDNTSGDEDDHDIAGVGVENFDLALIKVLSDDGFGDPADGLTENGAEVTFTITVINQGTIDATTFDVTDFLPAGFTLNDPAWTDNGDGTATISGGPLAAGDSVTLDITLTADGVSPGEAINLAEISSDDGTDIDSTPDSDPADDGQPAAPGDPNDDVTNNASGDSDDHDIAGVTIGEFDLALVKVYTSDTSVDGNANDGVVQVGDDATFTITVTNQGTLDADTFDVTDYLPVGLVLNDAAWTDNGDGTATTTGGPLAAGDSVDLTITATVTSTVAGELVNGAEISSDTATDVDSTPDADPADDNQPAAPGDPTDDVIDNTPDANGEADEDDHDIAGLTVDVYDLALVKEYTSDTSVDGNSTDGVIQPGDDVTFTVTVTNEGTVGATAVEVTDYLPAGFVLSATAPDSAAWTDNGDGTATTNVGDIAPGASTSVTITLTAVDTGAGPLVNVVEISEDNGDDIDSTPDADPDNEGGPGGEDDIDDAPVTVDAYDLALQKVYTSDTSADGNATDGVIAAGDDITFTITVFNQGTVDAADVDVTDFIPAGFVLSATSPDSAAWTDNGDGTAVTTVGAIAAGESIAVTITLTAVDPTLGDNLNAAEISAADGNDIDSTPNADVNDDGPITDDEINNAAGDEDDHDPAPFTVVEPVVPVFDLALRKTLADGSNTATVSVGETVTWTITVFNQGETYASNIDVIDYIPSGLALADSDWTETAAGDASITIAGPIPPGASSSVDITTTVVNGSDLENLAEIAAADAVDENGSLVLSDGIALVDIDSVADSNNSEVPVDDEVNNIGGDEDDHDGAVLTLAQTITPTSPPLAVTGSNWTIALFSWALGLFFLGAALVLFGRREDDLVAYRNGRGSNGR